MAATPERLIADRYALERPIGRGGMGVVWLAHDRLLDREVAIKEVTVPDTVPELERKSLRARAMREARAAARLSHPGAITLFDVLNEQGRAFIVMEWSRRGLWPRSWRRKGRCRLRRSRASACRSLPRWMPRTGRGSSNVTS